MQLILLAAGKGSRLVEKYRKKPKCLIKINSKTLLEHNLNFYNRFNNKIIITGYKSYYLKNFIKKNKFYEIKNNFYNSTNMVYSAFLPSKKILSDVVIVYSDIIFDEKIYDYLNKKKNIIPLNKNWLTIWKGRMVHKNIKEDAEDVVVKNNLIKTIGRKIKNKLPKYQFMGIIKIKNKNYFKLLEYFKNLKNKNIDFTNFINLAIKKKIVNFEAVKINKKIKWFEIDSLNDLDYTKKNIW